MREESSLAHGGDGPAIDVALGNLFLAIELVQSGMTDVTSIAAACHLPLDTIKEIAAAHEVNLSQADLAQRLL